MHILLYFIQDDVNAHGRAATFHHQRPLLQPAISLEALSDGITGRVKQQNNSVIMDINSSSPDIRPRLEGDTEIGHCSDALQSESIVCCSNEDLDKDVQPV